MHLDLKINGLRFNLKENYHHRKMTSKIYPISISSALLIMVLACGDSGKTAKSELKPTIPEQATDDSSRLKDGKIVYDIYCKMCHGDDGQQELTGTYNLVTSTMKIDDIINVTLEGRGTMLPYKDILSNKELVDVSQYVLAMQKK